MKQHNMETKHTPGPWMVEEQYDQMELDSTVICRVKFSGEVAAPEGLSSFVTSQAKNHGDQRATAALIAAAPKLLEACREAMDYFNDWESTTGSPVAEKLKAAIAKAEGRQ